MNVISYEAARRLRGGYLPHIPPSASPIGKHAILELLAPIDSAPEVIVTDTRRSLTWRVALESTAGSASAPVPSASKDAPNPTRQSPSPDVLWCCALRMPSQPTVLTYHFLFKDGTNVRQKRQREGVIQPLFGVWEEQDFRIAVFDPKGMPPKWVRGEVMYQIFPDRFAIGDPGSIHKKSDAVYGETVVYKQWGEAPEYPPKGRDFFGGDLRGVRSKLDYLQDLGISTVYFTPIFESPTNHRYDALDYFLIDARLGDEDTLRELVREAESRGISVMLDLVMNHCSSDSYMFKEAQADKRSPWYRRFEFSQWPDYAGWLGKVKTMPEFVECPETETFFFGPDGVAQYWLGTGICGFRTDVTPWITESTWRHFFKAIRAHNPNLYLVAEDWGDSTSRFTGDQFDATMNYRFAYSVVGFVNGKLTPSELDDRLEVLKRDTPDAIVQSQMNLLTSHDTPRLLNLVEHDRARLKLAVALQMAYPGVPMVYYGEEAGCTQINPPCESGRVPFPWDNIEGDLHAFYRKAIAARRDSAGLSFGNVETIWIDDEKRTYAFVRTHGRERVLALFNGGPNDATFALAASGTWQDVLGSLGQVRAARGMLRVTLPAHTSAWLARVSTPA